MREILFRGKRLNNGEWVEGDLLHLPHGIVILKNGYADIIPETIGQYTGLTDKNGKKIFEGDMVEYYGTYSLEVFIDKGQTKVRWYDTVTRRECSELFLGNYDEAYGECEIIGNIHDNPELLKGDNDAEIR